MKEIKSLRKSNEKHFLNKDGTITAYLYDRDVHYLKDNEYVEIDNKIIDGGNYLINKDNAFHTFFKKDKRSNLVVDIEKDNHYLKIYLNKKKSSKLNILNESNKVLFQDILDDIDFDYSVISTKLKESIILKNKNNIPESLVFKIETDLILRINNKKIEAKDLNNNIIFMIDAPYMWDNNKNYNYNITYSLEKRKEDYLLTLNLDKEWLSNAKFPVTIDPTLEAKDIQIFDAYIYSWDDVNYTYDNQVLKVGIDREQDTHIYQSLLKFDLPNLGTGSEIIDARVHLYSHPNDTSSDDYNNLIYVKAMEKEWNENNVNFWDLYDGEGEIIDYFLPKRSKLINNTVELQINSFNVTNLLKKWYAGKPNYGVMLTTDLLPANCPEYTFCSKEYTTPDGQSPKPFVEVVYRNLNGLEDYMSYQTQEYTEGFSYINNLTGNLTTAFNLNETISGKYPISLSMVYNTNDVILNNNLGYGLGYKFNLHQTLRKIYNNEVPYIEYLDADGTTHYFVEEKNDSGNVIPNSYIDEDGLNLKLKTTPGEYVITDKDGNKYNFLLLRENYYFLSEMINTKGDVVTIYYDGQLRINSIKDANNSRINIEYNGNNTIITSDHRTTTINYNNNQITSIVTKNGTTNFNYNNNNVLEKITDVNGLAKVFNYINTKPYKLKKVIEYGLNNEEGASLTFEYGFLFTRVIDNKGRQNVYSFNNRGNTIGVSNIIDENNIDDAYGIGYGYFSDNQKNSKLINSLSSQILPTKYTKNLLDNSSFEEEGGLGRTTHYSGRTDDYARSGSYSLNLKNSSVIKYLEGGKKYTFSGYFKNSDNVELVVSTEAYPEKPHYLFWGNIPKNDEFTRYSFSFDLPENNSLFCIDFGLEDGSEAYLDDMQLEEGNVANYYNFIQNGDFNDGYDGWNFVSNTKKYIIDNKILDIEFDKNNRVGFSKIIDLKGKKDDIYCLSFWYKNNGIIPSISNNEFVKKEFLNFNYLEEQTNEEFDNLNYFNNQWNYFSNTYKAKADFDGIDIAFDFIKSVGDIYFTNIMLTNGIEYEKNSYNLDNGNLEKVEKAEGTKTEFKYDKNNQLTSMFNPKGNNFKFEYDNQITDRILKGISPSGISNEIKYDNFGNPIKTLINNVNLDNKIISGNNYYIRLKGTDKYLDCDFLTKQINLKEDTCSHDAFNITKVGDYYRFNIMESYLTLVNNNQILLTKDNTSDNSLFHLEKNNNDSYLIIPKTKYITVNSNGGNTYNAKDYNLCNINNQISINSTNVDESNEQFYFEDIDTPLFIESKAEYTEDGKFITKTIDSLGKKTLYDINPLNGLTNSITDANEEITTYTYNDKEQITKVEKNNKEVNYTYNNQNLLSNITSGNKDYKFSYDNFLNTKDIKINNQTLVTNEYEPNNGNLYKTTYGNGSTVLYTYDELDRIKTIINDNNTINYKYNNVGNLAKVLGDLSSITYNYDSKNRLIEYSLGDGIFDDKFYIRYDYDKNSNIIKKSYRYDINNYDIIRNNITYDYNSDDAITKVTFDNNNLNYKYDYLGRLISKDINNNLKQEYKYITNGNKTSNTVYEVKIGNDVYNYKYDNLYNITDIYLNKELINHYEYDNFNELIKEDNYILNKTTVYTYDTEGNILNRKEYEINTDNLIKTDIYNYTNGNWEDQLTKFNNERIYYDEIGNPIVIGTKELTWVNGRQLQEYKDNNLKVIYSYGTDGIRRTKAVGDKITSYFTDNNKIIFEETGNNVIYYIRDEEGSLIGIKYNNEIYYYIKNLQEDIIGITDSDNNILCRYEYDSWGRIITIKDNNGNIIEDESHIGIINPYRYRSYYYDKETKLYYLNSRYYNPEWGRFINADKYVSTQQGMLSTNMYQYTENNPISRADTLGIFWFTVAGIVLGGIVGVAINGVVNVANGDNFFEGWLGAAAGGAFYGGIATTPLNFTLVGSAIMNYGSAFITETVSGIENIFKGTYEFGDITTGTVINGSLGMVISNPINVGETWIRPTSVVTSFTGNYQQKLIANQTITSALSGLISKGINKLTKKINERFEKLIGKFSNGLGFGGGASSGAGFGGGGGAGRFF